MDTINDIFGPSMKGIADTILGQEAWLDSRDAGHTEEEWHVERRVAQLYDLINLRKPVTWDEDVAVNMHFGFCPCPGVPRHCWDQEAAPMHE